MLISIIQREFRNRVESLDDPMSLDKAVAARGCGQFILHIATSSGGTTFAPTRLYRRIGAGTL